MIIEISGDVKAIITKIEGMCNDIKYNTTIKNKHEERITRLEKNLPDQLDSRLRSLELKTYLISVVVPILISISMFFIQKLIAGI